MKEDGADVIIVLTSSGVPWDREEVYNDFVNNKEKLSNINSVQIL